MPTGSPWRSLHRDKMNDFFCCKICCLAAVLYMLYITSPFDLSLSVLLAQDRVQLFCQVLNEVDLSGTSVKCTTSTILSKSTHNEMQ